MTDDIKSKIYRALKKYQDNEFDSRSRPKELLIPLKNLYADLLCIVENESTPAGGKEACEDPEIEAGVNFIMDTNFGGD